MGLKYEVRQHHGREALLTKEELISNAISLLVARGGLLDYFDAEDSSVDLRKVFYSFIKASRTFVSIHDGAEQPVYIQFI